MLRLGVVIIIPNNRRVVNSCIIMGYLPMFRKFAQLSKHKAPKSFNYIRPISNYYLYLHGIMCNCIILLHQLIVFPGTNPVSKTIAALPHSSPEFYGHHYHYMG